MSENKKNEDNIKNLIVSFSEWSDIDAFLELLLLIKNTNASILVLLAVSKTYGVDKNVISYNGKQYKTPTNFAQDHYKQEKPGKTNINGWKECECEIEGRWISISSLSELEY